MGIVGDVIEFVFLWLLSPQQKRREIFRMIRQAVINILRENGIRTDGDDVAIFVAGGLYCIKPAPVVSNALGVVRPEPFCKSLPTMVDLGTLLRHCSAREGRCSFDVKSTMTGKAAKITLYRLLLPKGVMIEYIYDVAPAGAPSPKRVFLFDKSMRIIGEIE